MKLLRQVQSVKKEILTALLVFIAITAIFFYQSILKGYIPAPGDLLVGHYEPYKSYSFLGFAPGGVPNKAQGPDVIKELFPWKHFVIEELKKGSIPFWNPHNFSGNPLMANFQSAVFYPGNLLFFLFPFTSAWTLYIFLIPLLSAAFTFLFLRELKLSKIASIFGGIVFAFSSYMVVWIEYGNIGHTFLWLPLALFFTEKLTQKFTSKRLFTLTLVLLVSLLGGYIQGYFYITIIIGFYFLLKLNRKQWVKRLLFFSGALCFPVLLSLFQLLPTFELFTYSSRGNYSLADIQNMLNPVWYLITLVAPDFFGNPATGNYFFSGTYIERVSFIAVIPIILAMLALFSFRKRKEIAILSILGIFVLLITTDLFITKYFYLLPIPMISTTVPTRMLSIFVFCACMLSAFGLEYLLEKGKKRALFIAIGAIGLLLLLAWVFVFYLQEAAQAATSKRNLVVPTVIVLFFIFLSFFYYKGKITKTLLITLIFFFTLFDLFRFFDKITPFSPKEFIYPQTPIMSYLSEQGGINRFWGYGSGYIESNFQTYDKTFSPEGNDPLHIKSYTELLETSKNGEIPRVLPRPDANVAPGFGSSDLENNFYRQKILNVLGVKYVLRKDEPIRTDDKTYKLVWQNGPWHIYENLLAAPRAFLTSDYVVIKDPKETFATFFSKDFNEKKTLILPEDPYLAKEDLVGTVELLRYEPNDITLATSSQNDGLLFLSDNYYPGWKATVDGKKTKIYLADYTFRAVVVPKGDHVVSFFYKPDSFRNGVWLSALSFVVLIVLFLKFRTYEIS